MSEFRYYLYQEDCLEVLRRAPDCYFDSVVTDPPAGIGFMNREWDSDKGGRVSWVAWMTEVMRECYRVMKPGAHGVVWAIPRTSHWTATALEEAGFEVRDVITHHFGCLSEDTEILLDGRWEPYHKIEVGRHALCYNVDEGTYSWQPIQETFIYDYADTAYRLRGDHTDQIVSRNHRCLVEREGTLVFELAEALARQRQARVPVLEDVSGLFGALSMSHEGAGSTEHDLLVGMSATEAEPRSSGSSHRSYSDPSSRDLRTLRCQENMATEGVAVSAAVLLRPQLPRKATGVRAGHGDHRGNGAQRLDRTEPSVLSSEDDRSQQSGMERRGHLLSEARQLREREVCPVSRFVQSDGAQGRLCDGASTDRGAASGEMSVAVRGGTSRQPRSNRQSTNQPDVVQQQSGSQTVRGDRFTRTDLVTVEPVRYVGKVWCVRVPTGVFVARRNGQVFITGNSGFPKSQDVGKFIDKLAGAERKVVAFDEKKYARMPRNTERYEAGEEGTWQTKGGIYNVRNQEKECQITVPATDDAKQWDGWGTALKPATEHWILVRKPLSESSIARNILKWGTGALNIDACRVNRAADDVPGWHKTGANGSKGYQGEETFKIREMTAEEVQERCGDKGRWPTNLLLTHSPECDDSTCVETCPVAELDRQSGQTRSTAAPRRNSAEAHNRTSSMGKSSGDWVSGGHSDSGGASRFFPTFRCNECWLCQSKLSVVSVDESSQTIHQTSEVIVPENVVSRREGQFVQLVSSVGNLCEKCATTIARAIVALKLNRKPEEPLGARFTDVRSQRILNQNLALLADSLESADTIPTIQNLRLWFGYVQLAIIVSTLTDEKVSEIVPTRFLYKAKPSRSERERGLDALPDSTLNRVNPGGIENDPRWAPVTVKNNHPTVKSAKLMAWLCRLITPPGGLILDPFCGSGSTGVACMSEGFRFVGIEQDAHYIAIAQARIECAANEATVEDLSLTESEFTE